MVGVLCVQHMNCWLQHLHELFDFPFCLENCFFFYARHNLLHYNSSWQQKQQIHTHKKNTQQHAKSMLVLFSPWKYRNHRIDYYSTRGKKKEVLLSGSINATVARYLRSRFSQFIVKGQGHLTKRDENTASSVCVRVFTDMHLCVIHVLCAGLCVGVLAHLCVCVCVGFFTWVILV